MKKDVDIKQSQHRIIMSYLYVCIQGVSKMYPAFCCKVISLTIETGHFIFLLNWKILKTLVNYFGALRFQSIEIKCKTYYCWMNHVLQRKLHVILLKGTVQRD